MKRLSEIQIALKAPKNQKGYGYSYRKASDILQEVKPHLAKHKLTILLNDKVQEMCGKFFLIAEAAIYGEDGQKIASSEAFAEMDNHKGMSAEQATGSASSYARKYALCGLLAIDDSSADADDPEVKIKDALAEIDEAVTNEDLDKIIKKYESLKGDKRFVDAGKAKRAEIATKKPQTQQQ